MTSTPHLLDGRCSPSATIQRPKLAGGSRQTWGDARCIVLLAPPPLTPGLQVSSYQQYQDASAEEEGEGGEGEGI